MWCYYCYCHYFRLVDAFASGFDFAAAVVLVVVLVILESIYFVGAATAITSKIIIFISIFFPFDQFDFCILASRFRLDVKSPFLVRRIR